MLSQGTGALLQVRDIIHLPFARMSLNVSFSCDSSRTRQESVYGPGIYGRAGGLHQRSAGRNIIPVESSQDGLPKEIV